MGLPLNRSQDRYQAFSKESEMVQVHNKSWSDSIINTRRFQSAQLPNELAKSRLQEDLVKKVVIWKSLPGVFYGFKVSSRREDGRDRGETGRERTSRTSGSNITSETRYWSSETTRRPMSLRSGAAALQTLDHM